MQLSEKWKNVKRERWLFDIIYVCFRDKKKVGLSQNGFYVVFNSGFIHVEQKMLLLEMSRVSQFIFFCKRKEIFCKKFA